MMYEIFQTYDWDKITDMGIEEFKKEINEYLDKELNENNREIVEKLKLDFELELLKLYINKRGEYYSKVKVEKKVKKVEKK